MLKTLTLQSDVRKRRGLATRLVTATSLLALLVFAAPGYPVAIIDFGTGNAGTGGTLTISGGNAVGTNIPVDTLTVTGAPLNDGVYDLSGTATSSNQDANKSAALNFNTSTGAISIVGGVPFFGVPATTTLLSGTITSFIITNNSSTLGQIGLISGKDTKSPELLAHLGLFDTQFELSGFSLAVNSKQTGSPFVAISTDISNIQAVPEPASLLLLGFGIAGLGIWQRQKSRRS